jgi:hypothetical protein
MANPTITIPLDPQTARVYNSADPDQKRKIQALLSLWLRELTSSENPPWSKSWTRWERKQRPAA